MSWRRHSRRSRRVATILSSLGTASWHTLCTQSRPWRVSFSSFEPATNDFIAVCGALSRTSPTWRFSTTAVMAHRLRTGRVRTAEPDPTQMSGFAWMDLRLSGQTRQRLESATSGGHSSVLQQGSHRGLSRSVYNVRCIDAGQKINQRRSPPLGALCHMTYGRYGDRRVVPSVSDRPRSVQRCRRATLKARQAAVVLDTIRGGAVGAGAIEGAARAIRYEDPRGAAG